MVSVFVAPGKVSLGGPAPSSSKRAVRIAYPDNEEMIINNKLDDWGAMLGNLLFLAFLRSPKL